MHQTLRKRLGREPVPAATASLRERIATGVRHATPPVMPPPATPSAAPATSALPASVSARDVRVRVVGIAALLAVVIALASFWRASDWAAPTDRNAEQRAALQTSQAVPLFAAVLSDYRRVTAGDLPGRARDLGAVRAAVPFTVTPLGNPGLRLLAAWTTSLAGEPAAVLAYRWNDRVVLQYLVSDALLFQSPNVRALLAQKRAVSARDGAQGLLVWAQPESGSVLVGELSPEELGALHDDSAGR
jgi:hypothetical protein